LQKKVQKKCSQTESNAFDYKQVNAQDQNSSKKII